MAAGVVCVHESVRILRGGETHQVAGTRRIARVWIAFSAETGIDSAAPGRPPPAASNAVTARFRCHPAFVKETHSRYLGQRSEASGGLPVASGIKTRLVSDQPEHVLL